MKIKLIFLLFTLHFASSAQFYPLHPQELDPIDIIENYRHKFPDEILLKERLKTEIPNGQSGEIHYHKVGNGFNLPAKNSSFKIKWRCLLPETQEFLILKNDKGQLMALLSHNRNLENIAEFLDVKEVLRTVIIKRFRFLTGSNPLRGEMFQLEWKSSEEALLRIVAQEKLHHYLTVCKEQ